MSEVSKNELKYDNSVSFPNNNNGAITPAGLRAFNVDLIDSTVNQTTYNQESASFTSRIIDANTDIAGLISTASVNLDVLTFTKFNGSTFSLAVTASAVNVQWDNVLNKPAGLVSGSSQVVSILTPLNAFSASQITKDSTLATYTGSVNTKFTTIGSQSGSWNNTSLNAYTASNNTKWSNLGSQSGSFVTESETGSFARINTTNTFTATQTINADLIVSGTINAYKINTTIESSSVIFSSGSNILGDNSTSDTQTLNGVTNINGNVNITGSSSLAGNLNVSGGFVTFNSPPGNTLTLQNGGLSSDGTITGYSNLNLLGQNPSFKLQGNVEGSGSQYPQLNITVAPNVYTDNIFGGFTIIREEDIEAGLTFLGMAANSYTPQYGPTTVPMIIAAGNNPDGNDTAIIFAPNGTAEHYKKSDFKYGVDITGSINQTNGNVTITGSILQRGGNSTFEADVNMNSNLNVGMNITADKLVLTGGSGADLVVTGSGTISSNLVVGGVSEDKAYMGTGVVAVFSSAGNEIGLVATGNPGEWDGPAIYTYDPNTEGYPASIGLQSSTNWTDGRVTIFNPLILQQGTEVTGSVNGNVNTLSVSSFTASFDFNTSNFFELNLSDNNDIRVEATNVKPGQTINVLVKQAPLIGGGTVTFSDVFKFPSISPYTPTATAQAQDLLTFITFNDTSSIYSAGVNNLI